MGDLREYSFGDWFLIFIRALPAYVLAVLVIALILAVPVGLIGTTVRLLMH
jgi:hypothetical protein